MGKLDDGASQTDYNFSEILYVSTLDISFRTVQTLV